MYLYVIINSNILYFPSRILACHIPLIFTQQQFQISGISTLFRSIRLLVLCTWNIIGIILLGLFESLYSPTAWKVSKYGVFCGPHYPSFRLNTERYWRISPYSVGMRGNTDQKKLRIWTLFRYSPKSFFQDFRKAFSKSFSYWILTRTGKFTTRYQIFWDLVSVNHKSNVTKQNETKRVFEVTQKLPRILKFQKIRLTTWEY